MPGRRPRTPTLHQARSPPSGVTRHGPFGRGRAGRAWSWALAEIVLPDSPRAAGLRVTVLVAREDDDAP